MKLQTVWKQTANKGNPLKTKKIATYSKFFYPTKAVMKNNIKPAASRGRPAAQQSREPSDPSMSPLLVRKNVSPVITVHFNGNEPAYD
jgi:hypothetical protein